MVLECRYRQTHHGRPRIRSVGSGERRICLFRRPVSAHPSCRSRSSEGSFRGHAGDLRELRDRFPHYGRCQGPLDIGARPGGRRRNSRRYYVWHLSRRDGTQAGEEANELLAGEMSHRVKNFLAIASGLTLITSRSTTTAADLARDLTGRLAALGRAHDLVGPSQAGGKRQLCLEICCPSCSRPMAT